MHYIGIQDLGFSCPRFEVHAWVCNNSFLSVLFN